MASSQQQQMDGPRSFMHLINSIPSWRDDMNELVAKCDNQFDRFTKLTRHGEVKLVRQKRHGSTESLRTSNEVKAAPILDGIPDPATENDIMASSAAAGGQIDVFPSSPEPQATALAFQELRRKRPAASELSGAPSHGNDNYRTKSMVVVYYDSEIQIGFEALVKSMATARNNLRKGKNAASFQARMLSLGVGDEATSPPTASSQEQVMQDPKAIMTRSRALRMAQTNAIRSNGAADTKAFEDADRDLEETQNLCERAAHQFLRDGDCHREFEGMRKRLSSCEAIAQSALGRLQNQEATDKPNATDDKEDEETLVCEKGVQSGSRTSSAKNEKLTMNGVAATEKLGPAQIDLVSTGPIEVDDESDDDESIQIDLNAIRRTVRATRV